MFLAAEGEDARHRCVHALRAAISGEIGAFMKDVASTVAVTPHLVGMKNLSTFNNVAVLLGRPAASGLDVKSLKQVGFGGKELEAVGFSLWDTIGAGCIATEYSIVSFSNARCCSCVCCRDCPSATFAALTYNFNLTDSCPSASWFLRLCDAARPQGRRWLGVERR